jgi:glutamyl endopeptidase
MAAKNRMAAVLTARTENGSEGAAGAGTVDGYVGTEPPVAPREAAETDGHRPVANDPTARAEAADGPVGETELPVAVPTVEAAAGEEDESLLLDAWYASFASPATRALVRRELRSGEPLTEVVIGPDDRQQITATTTYPWRAICSLLITAANGTRWIGTGWFAGPRLVMTAGHCVFMRDQGGWARSIDVIPGRNGASRPYGTRTSTAFRSVSGWTQQNNREYDYGAILVTGGTAPGSQTGFFGYGVRSNAELLSYTVNVSGYPGDKPAGTQWWHARRIDAVTARTFSYQIDTAGGQSGAPAWVLLNNTRTAVGIHTNGAPSGNSATRITQDVFNNIQLWRTQAGT